MERCSESAKSCCTGAIHAYVVVFADENPDTERAAREAIERYAREHLAGSPTHWHVDRLPAEAWDWKFLKRPEAANLHRALRPGDSVVFASASRSAARPSELRPLLRSWLAIRTTVHFADCPPFGSLSASDVGPITLAALELVSRLRAVERKPRKKSRRRRTSKRKATGKSRRRG